MFNLDLEKEEVPEIILSTSLGSSKTQESSRKASTSELFTMPKPLCGPHYFMFVCCKTTMTELSRYNKANDFQNLNFLLSASL